MTPSARSEYGRPMRAVRPTGVGGGILRANQLAPERGLAVLGRPTGIATAGGIVARNRTDIEQWAYDLLASHLADRGTTLSLLGRPDQANRTTPDVDFLVDVGGREVAIEVTQLALTVEWWRTLARLEAAIHDHLARSGQTSVLGGFTVHLRLRALASYRTLDLAAEQVASALVAHPELQTGQRADVLLPPPAADFVDVEMTAWSRRADRVAFIKSNVATGGATGPRAAAFVDWLVDEKADQTRRYREAWIVVIDTEVVVDAENLGEALASAQPQLPANWTRLYFLPAIDRSAIVEFVLSGSA